MFSLWRQSRFLRNEPKIFTATINKSKEPKSLVSIFFDFIKQWWALISVSSFALTIALLIGAYSSVFSGDIGASIEYVQAYISSMGITKIAVILVLVMLSFTVLFFIPAHASRWWFEEKWQGKSILKRFLWAGFVYAICIVGALFAGLIFTFLSGGYFTDPSTARGYFKDFLIWVLCSITLFIFATPILLDFMKACHVKEKRSRRSWITIIVVVIAMVGSLWSPENILLFINNGKDEGYIACVYGDRVINGKSEFFAETAIPVSYDTKGVHVFSGEYNNKRWTNVRREYLYFDEGYKVIFGGKCPERAKLK